MSCITEGRYMYTLRDRIILSIMGVRWNALKNYVPHVHTRGIYQYTTVTSQTICNKWLTLYEICIYCHNFLNMTIQLLL